MKSLLRKAIHPGSHDAGTAFGLLVLRLALGGMMLAAHGWPKLATFSDRFDSFPNPIGIGSGPSLILAVFAEVFCSLAVMLGLFTRAAAVPLLITMLVAAFIVHADDPFQRQEFALLYAVPFFMLVFTGAGAYSLDAKLRR